MALTNLTPEEFFPIIKQTLSDAFQLDSCLMYPPYYDFEKLDLGLRKMVWGKYSTNRPIFSLDDHTPYQIVIFESSLGFYNIIINLSAEESPVMAATMPFCTKTIQQTQVNKIMEENAISLQHASTLYRFYLALPVIDLDVLLLTLQHLITAFLPEFASHRVEYISYASQKHESNPSEERFEKFSSDFMEELHRRMEACCQAILSGNTNKALETMKSVIDYSVAFHYNSLSLHRHELSILNIFICSRLFETGIHPYYIYSQASALDQKINHCSSSRELFHLPFEIARKYAILSKNYAYDNYSYLIRNVINHINRHLSSDLSLSVLASEFDKNPSYLSNAFKKEVGETITAYIGRQRIQTSLKYFNTTNLSVAEVSSTVGISDFGYFSKLFKKYVGISPREYKKMLDK